MITTMSADHEPLGNAIFSYDTLSSYSAQFRLLRVLAVRDGRIDVRLDTFDLHTNGPQWHALSYRWGEEQASIPIWLNGKDFHVRSSLHSFLQQLAKEEYPFWIFVDAICINQDDVGERNSQVSLMRDIYKMAQEVTIWIPLNVGDSWHKLLEEYTPQRVQLALDNKHSNSSTRRRDARKDLIHVGHCLFIDDFWSRLWVTQEVLLADRLTIRYFGTRVDPIALLDEEVEKLSPAAHSVSLIRTASYEQTLGQPFTQNLLRAWYLLSLRTSRSSGIRGTELLALHEMMILCSGMRCRFFHDRVFGLFGIASTRIQPDYNTPFAHFMVDTIADSLISLGFRKASSPESLESIAQTDVKLLGRAITYGLNFDPIDALAFLVFHEISEYFVPETSSYLHFSLINEELKRARYKVDKRDRLKFDRKWYELYPSAYKRHERSERSRFDEAEREMNDNKLHNRILSARWHMDSGSEDARSCAEWSQMVQARCETLFSRWLVQEHTSNDHSENN